MNTKILLIEPFFTGSHKKWSLELQEKSFHRIDIIELPGRHWKWRMQGGAIELAKRFMEKKEGYDLILASDMLDLSLFKSLTNYSCPAAIYFHENQLTYPWSPSDPDKSLNRDLNYGFINYKSALVADKLFFNSRYHMESFLKASKKMISAFPDFNSNICFEKKSEVLPLGLDLSQFDRVAEVEKSKTPLILWNHRWEYDKNPDDFFETLIELKKECVSFQLAVLGESFTKVPPIFKKAKEQLFDRIIQWGSVDSFDEYASWLKKVDILPVTNNQDFFGISVVEAIYCNTIPLLPNRLSYPEHIDGIEFFYSDKKELKEKLRSRLQNYPEKINVSSWVDKYDWKKIIPRYDEALLSLI